MEKVTIENKDMELVLGGNVAEKAKELNITNELIQAILKNNPEAVLEAEEKEEVVIVGNPTIVFFKTADQIVVTNLFNKQNIY